MLGELWEWLEPGGRRGGATVGMEGSLPSHLGSVWSWMPWDARPRGMSSVPQGQRCGQGESLARAMLGKVDSKGLSFGLEASLGGRAVSEGPEDED